VGTLITAIHVIVCIILIVAVLLQSGKAADLAGAFGGAGSQTVFGPRGAGTLLSKITTICAILFMFTSIGLWVLSAKGTKSVLSGESTPKKEVPAATQTKKENPTPTAKDTGQKQQPKQEKQQTTSEKDKK